MRTTRLTGVRIAGAAAILAIAGAAGAQDVRKLTDHDVATAIEEEIREARGVSINRIDLEVDEGVATLSGTVNNILARDRAVRIARMVRGVRAVVDNIEVRATGRSDGEISSDVSAALAAEPVAEPWEISVSAEDGVVTLAGVVEGFPEKWLAAKVAKGVKGVRGVENNIVVTNVIDRPDDELQTSISKRLAWDVRVDDAKIDVEVSDGAVRLTGAVGSAHERRLAEQMAMIDGVRSVDAEDLEVRPAMSDAMRSSAARASLTDSAVREGVEQAMFYDPRVFSREVDVRAEDGVVTLSGTVETVKEKRAAAQDARNTRGVRRVINNLKVRPPIELGEEEIARNVRNAILRDPFVDRREVEVEVDDGVAYLRGNVDSYFERAQAGDLAARTTGVTEVRNRLDVGYDIFAYSTYHDWDPVLYDLDYDYKIIHQKDDSEIRDEIRSELFWSPFVGADEVNVRVEDGVATLSGTVDSWAEVDAAIENAIEGGAIKVINELRVPRG